VTDYLQGNLGLSNQMIRLGLDGKAKDEVWNGFLAKVAESLK